MACSLSSSRSLTSPSDTVALPSPSAAVPFDSFLKLYCHRPCLLVSSPCTRPGTSSGPPLHQVGAPHHRQINAGTTSFFSHMRPLPHYAFTAFTPLRLGVCLRHVWAHSDPRPLVAAQGTQTGSRFSQSRTVKDKKPNGPH